MAKRSAKVRRAIARKRPGSTPKPGQTVTIRSKGKEPLKFKKGGLHASLGVKQGEKIPEYLVAEAVAGKHGPKAKRQAKFYMNVLRKGQRTAAKGR